MLLGTLTLRSSETHKYRKKPRRQGNVCTWGLEERARVKGKTWESSVTGGNDSLRGGLEK